MRDLARAEDPGRLRKGGIRLDGHLAEVACELLGVAADDAARLVGLLLRETLTRRLDGEGAASDRVAAHEALAVLVEGALGVLLERSLPRVQDPEALHHESVVLLDAGRDDGLRHERVAGHLGRHCRHLQPVIRRGQHNLRSSSGAGLNYSK